jgi:hypothetical protein
MKTHRPIRSGLALVFFLTLIAGSSGGHTAAANATTFSGQATAVRGSIAAVPMLNALLPCNPQSTTYFCIVDTGPLTATQAVQGGANDASLACYPSGPNCVIQSPMGDPTNGAIKARVLHAAVVAGGNRSRAEASVANLALNVAGVNLSADFLTASASAQCSSGAASVSGSADVARANSQPVLTIGPYTFVVAETPNYDVLANAPPAVTALLPAGTQIIINKQASGENGTGGRQIDVTALYVNVPGIAELFIADVHADITCAALPQCPGRHAFVTSGGFIDLTGSNKQHFAAAGRNLTNWGHVLYRDTATGYSLHVKDPYGVVYTSFDNLKRDADAQGFDTSRLDATKFQGGAILTWDGGRVLLVDEGEPGRNDYFQIIAPPGAVTGGLLAGGNIQMHGKC